MFPNEFHDPSQTTFLFFFFFECMFALSLFYLFILFMHCLKFFVCNIGTLRMHRNIWLNKPLPPKTNGRTTTIVRHRASYTKLMRRRTIGRTFSSWVWAGQEKKTTDGKINVLRVEFVETVFCEMIQSQLAGTNETCAQVLNQKIKIHAGCR